MTKKTLSTLAFNKDFLKKILEVILCCYYKATQNTCFTLKLLEMLENRYKTYKAKEKTYIIT